jgi:hypothetical protein
MTMLELSETEMEAFVEGLLLEPRSMVLTIDELVTVSLDLELDRVLADGLGFDIESVDRAAARRSLAARGLAVRTEDDETKLVDWFAYLVDVAADPLLMVSMRRETPAVSYEWTLFTDGNIGLQQQVDPAGLIAWATFSLDDTMELIVGALALENIDCLEAGSFTAPLSALAAADQAIDEISGAEASTTTGVLSAEAAYRQALPSGSGTSMISVLDRSVEPATAKELVWTELGESGYWTLDIPQLEDPAEDGMVIVTNRSGADMFRLLALLFPIDEAVLSDLETIGEQSP